MKRSKLNKVSKQPISKMQRQIWELRKKEIYERDKNKDGSIDCYTCPAQNLMGANRQLGHGPWPKAALGAFLKYDPRVLKFQCFRCNIHMGGMGAEFYKRLNAEIGPTAMKQLEADRRVTVKAYTHYSSILSIL